MKRHTKNCGNCKFFQKLKNDPVGSGLCERKDWRTEADRGSTYEE